jgi:hypothetical protein
MACKDSYALFTLFETCFHHYNLELNSIPNTLIDWLVLNIMISTFTLVNQHEFLRKIETFVYDFFPFMLDPFYFTLWSVLSCSSYLLLVHPFKFHLTMCLSFANTVRLNLSKRTKDWPLNDSRFKIIIHWVFLNYIYIVFFIW